MTEVLLELRRVSRSYSGADMPALREANLTVLRGDFIAIIGPSGSGKSTLLNILGLLDQATDGQYLIGGVDTAALPEKERDRMRAHTFGFVFQSSHVLPEETTARNAALGLRIQGLNRNRKVPRVQSALRSVGLGHKSLTPGKLLSGGERQRLAIARAMATEPMILLADEPTGNLDSENGHLIIEHLQALNRQSVTVVVITHDESVAAAARRRMRITDGNLVEEKVLDGENSGGAPEPGHSEPRTHADLSGARPGGVKKWARSWVDDSSDALSSLTGKPTRALLLILAFVLGTGGLVASIGLTETASQQISQRLVQAALDEVTVSLPPSPGDNASASDARSIASGKIEKLDGAVGVGQRQDIPAQDAAVYRLEPKTVDGQSQFPGRAIGADASLIKLYDAEVAPASASALLDNTFGAPVALLGATAAAELGINQPAPGVAVWVTGQRVNVVGIITSSPREPELLNSVVVSLNAVKKIGSSPNLIVRTKPGYPAPLAEAIPLALDPANPGAIKVSTVADLRSLRRGVSTDLSSFLAIIAWILLALACLSAAATMYLTVQSRSPEIALRRALGTSRSGIRRIFLIEGALVGVAGGIAGAAAGLASVVLISGFQHWTPFLSLSSLGTGVAAGVATGIASAVYPAFQAARANPSIAIRG